MCVGGNGVPAVCDLAIADSSIPWRDTLPRPVHGGNGGWSPAAGRGGRCPCVQGCELTSVLLLAQPGQIRTGSGLGSRGKGLAARLPTHSFPRSRLQGRPRGGTSPSGWPGGQEGPRQNQRFVDIRECGVTLKQPRDQDTGPGTNGRTDGGQAPSSLHPDQTLWCRGRAEGQGAPAQGWRGEAVWGAVHIERTSTSGLPRADEGAGPGGSQGGRGLPTET